MQSIEELTVGDLRISPTVDEDHGAIRCDWNGRSTDRHPSKVLTPWFDTLLGRAAEHHTSVSMHFDALEHFNSSTIGAIVQLIKTARARNVPLTLVYSSQHRWQRISFEALRVFDRDDALFHLETV